MIKSGKLFSFFLYRVAKHFWKSAGKYTSFFLIEELKKFFSKIFFMICSSRASAERLMYVQFTSSVQGLVYINFLWLILQKVEMSFKLDCIFIQLIINLEGNLETPVISLLCYHCFIAKTLNNFSSLWSASSVKIKLKVQVDQNFSEGYLY